MKKIRNELREVRDLIGLSLVWVGVTLLSDERLFKLVGGLSRATPPTE